MNRCWLISVVIALVLCSTISCKTAGKTDQGFQEGPQGESTVKAPQLAEGMFAKIVTPRGTIKDKFIEGYLFGLNIIRQSLIKNTAEPL